MPAELHNRSRFWIDKAKQHPKTINPQSNTSVQHTLMTVFWRRIYGEEGFCKIAVGRFFNEELRRANARHDDRQGADDQLALWPDAYRPLLKQIDRAEVYVPSRKEWVRLEPGEISRSNVKEAAEYLRQQGRETIRRGDWLDALAELMPEDDRLAAD